MKKKIMLILTGGTISMHKHDVNNMIDISNDHEVLINEIKYRFREVEIEYHVHSLIPSPHMTLSKMFTLTKLIEKTICRTDIDGIVVTHGTDTLEESAYMTDLYVDSEKPIIFTGSMRSYSDVSYDGIRNLISSILVASSDDSKNQGVLVVLNDEINAASEVTKTHTLALDTFKSMDFGALGVIDDSSVIYYRSRLKNTKHIKNTDVVSEVEIVKISAGCSSLLLNLLIDSGISGIVIEALGRGNIPPNLVNTVQRALDNNIVVVLTSRVPRGRVLGSYGYAGGGGQLQKMGVIFAPNLNSQKARIKLLMLLNSQVDRVKFPDFFL